MDDESFRRILDFFGLSWRGYRRVRRGVKKRLARRMAFLGFQEVKEYLCLLDRNAAEVQVARRILTVTISRFFRDRRVWDVLRESVLPDLAASSPRGVRVWCAGCACGEEVYSLKIAWHEMMSIHACHIPMEIWATDLNPKALQMAERGEYGTSSLRDLEPRLLDKYFAKSGHHHRVCESLRHCIHWECRDIVSDAPPVSSPDLVFLRYNLLTYHAENTVRQVFERVVDNLRLGGYLVVGNNEQIPAAGVFSHPVASCRCIWRKLEPDGAACLVVENHT